MQVGNMLVHTIEDVKQAIKRLKAEGHLYCDLLMAQTELRDGLTQEGIPQIHIDQLNTRYFINTNFIANQQVPIVASNRVYNYALSKLTHRKLLKQVDWKEWQKSEYLQVGQYQKQFMLGSPTHVND